MIANALAQLSYAHGGSMSFFASHLDGTWATRAAQHLLVTHCAQRQRKPAAPSRWLQAVTDSTALDVPAPPPTRSRLPTDPLLPLREWRAAIARVSGQPELAVCSDRVLRSLAQAPPADAAELARRLGITETAAARLRPLPT